ncbi:UDP-N-acetylglucosamine 2-epimerase (non-hydrolyzing), partial [bacterium]
GTVRLVGTNFDLIVTSVTLLLNDNEEYKKMSTKHNPYGSGTTAKSIVATIL